MHCLIKYVKGVWKEEEIKILPFWVHIQHSPKKKKGQILRILNSNPQTNLKDNKPQASTPSSKSKSTVLPFFYYGVGKDVNILFLT